MNAPDPRAALAARCLMALIFVVAGVRKLLAYGATQGYFESLGLPLPAVVLPLTIAFELGGAAALVAGWRLAWVAPAMAAFSILTALSAHRFWAAPPELYSSQLNHFLKNVAMCGGFVLLAAVAPRKR